MPIRSNPVVFPFRPFKHLRKPSKDNIAFDLHIRIRDLEPFFYQNDLERIPVHGNTVEEKIFSLFLHPDLRFGPEEYLTNQKNEWLKKIRLFTEQQLPLQFTILGFPGKAPVPLKTNRILPDFGELLALKRLHNITRLIQYHYKYGAEITVITEGALGEVVGISPRAARCYELDLERWTRLLHWTDHLRFVPLKTMQRSPGFDRLYAEERQSFRRMLLKKDRPAMKKFQAAYPSIFHLLNVRNVPESLIKEVYSGSPRSVQGRKLSQTLHKRAHEAVINYFALLKTRDRLGFLEQTVPHSLSLTVSPKPGRLGIHLIDRRSNLLAHHGVPFGDHIDYLVDVLHHKTPLVRIFVKEDQEQKPFFYLAL